MLPYREPKQKQSNSDQCGSGGNSRNVFGARGDVSALDGSVAEHRHSSLDKGRRREWKERATDFSSTSVNDARRVVSGSASDDPVSTLGGGCWQQTTTTAAGQDNGEKGENNKAVADKGVLRGRSAAMASGALSTSGSLSHYSYNTTPAKEGGFGRSPQRVVSDQAGNASQPEPEEAGDTDQMEGTGKIPLFGNRQDTQDRGKPSNSSAVDLGDGDRDVERPGVQHADDRGDLARRQIDQALRERALRRRRRFGHC